jgi:hypothetical protein
MVTPERLANWNNQEPDNKNLEALSILVSQLLDKLHAAELEIEQLKNP